jgi:hypothetical protein
MTIFDGPQRVKITCGAHPWDATVEIGGVRIEDALRGFTIRHGYGRFPELTLDLPVADASEVDEEQVKIVMPGSTHDLLVRAGWLPPGAFSLDPLLSAALDAARAAVAEGLPATEAAYEIVNDERYWRESDQLQQAVAALIAALIAREA